MAVRGLCPRSPTKGFALDPPRAEALGTLDLSHAGPGGLLADDPTIPFHRQSWSDIRLA